MKIRIGKYTLTSDGHHNLIANETAKRKDGGEPSLRPVAFFSKLEHFCKWALDQRVLKSKAESIEELKIEIMAAKAEIIEAVQELEHGKVGQGKKKKKNRRDRDV